MTESDMDIYEHLMKTAASEKRITIKVWLCGHLAYRWVAGRMNCSLYCLPLEDISLILA